MTSDGSVWVQYVGAVTTVPIGHFGHEFLKLNALEENGRRGGSLFCEGFPSLGKVSQYG